MSKLMSDIWWDVHCGQAVMNDTAEKLKFSIKDFFSKCDKIRRKLRICSYLLKTFLTENFVFLCSVTQPISERAIIRISERNKV